jgi:hypothetical protein
MSLEASAASGMEALKFLALGPCFFPETGRFSKKNREAIEHERAITERD